MKKIILPLFAILFLSYGNAYSLEISGLRPIAPYGIFSTFSTDTPLRGTIAISTDAEISLDPDLYRFFLKSAYGITDDIEFDINIPYTLGSSSPDGFEDIALGFKHRFFKEAKYGPSIAYILTASLPSGRDEFSTDGRLGLGVIMSKRVGPVNGHVNLFYVMPGKGELDNEVALLAGLDFSASHNFKILAELDCRTNFKSGKVDLLEGRIGYRIRTTNSLYTTIGAGYDFKNRTPEARLMFSITYIQQKKKREIKKIYEEE